MCDGGEQINVFLTPEYIEHLYDYNPEFRPCDGIFSDSDDGETNRCNRLLFRTSAQNKSQEQLDDIAKEETDYSSKNGGNLKSPEVIVDDGNEPENCSDEECSPSNVLTIEGNVKEDNEKEQTIKNLCQQKSVKSQNGINSNEAQPELDSVLKEYLGRKREMNETNESEREMNETNKNERNRNNLERRDNLRKKYIDWLRKNWKIKKNPNSNADKSLSEQQKKLNNVLDKIVEKLKISPYLFNDERLDEKTFLLELLSKSITEGGVDAFLEKCTNEKNEKLDDETLKKFGIKYGMVGFKEYLKDKLSEENLKIYLETAEKVIEGLPSYMKNHKKEKKMFTTSKSSE